VYVRITTIKVKGQLSVKKKIEMYVPSVIILLDRVFRPYASDEGCVLGKLCSTPPRTHRNKMGAYELNLFTFHGEEGSGEGGRDKKG